MSGRRGRSFRQYFWLIFTMFLGTAGCLLLSAMACPGQKADTAVPVCQQMVVQPLTPESSDPTEKKLPPRINILLIGHDGRQCDTPSRSDTMILCSFSREDSNLTMVSFLRDLYVQIPDHGSNRLNAAYALGGMSLLRDTICQNFGVRIDGCVEVDFQTFSQLVDLMGGVTMNLRQDEAAAINRACSGSQLTAGDQLLTGQQALSYVRLRKLDADGDFSRTLRQRNLLQTLVLQLRACSVLRITELVKTAAGMVTTDLSLSQILAYCSDLLPTLSRLETRQLHIPADGAYTRQTVNGMDVLIADPDQTSTIVRNALAEN